MTQEHRYVIVLDEELGFAKLFRADSEDCPSTDFLWSGMGLRRGYDAMIRLNRESRPIVAYHVCTRKGSRGRDVFRIFKSAPEKAWSVLAIVYRYEEARERLRDLGKARDRAEAEAAAEYEAEVREVMERTGIVSRHVVRLTATDRRYVEWLKLTGRFAKEAA